MRSEIYEVPLGQRRDLGRGARGSVAYPVDREPESAVARGSASGSVRMTGATTRARPRRPTGPLGGCLAPKPRGVLQLIRDKPP